MPVLIRGPLLALILIQGQGASPARDPLDMAIELLRHERVKTNELLAVSDIRTAISNALDSSPPPPPPAEPKHGYRFRSRAGAHTAVPDRPGETGIHGFCGDASGRVCYTKPGAEPLVTGGRCAPSCRDLPKDWVSSLFSPPLSPAEQAALAAALDTDRRLQDQPALKETVRGLLAAAAPPAAPQSGRAHAGSVNALAFTPDGTGLITASTDTSRATLWSVASRQPLTTLSSCDSVFKVLVTPDGGTAVTSCSKSVKLWSLPDWSAQGSLGSFDTILVDLSLDRSGKVLATVASGQAALWQLPSGRALASFDLAPGKHVLGSHGAMAPDGTTLVTGGFEQPTATWALPRGTRVATLEASARVDVAVIAISGNGRTVAVGYGDGTVALWALPERRLIARRKEHGFPVNGLAFSADGAWLVSAASDTSVKVWAVSDATVRHTLRGHATEVFAVAVSSAGLIASADRNGVVLLWDLATGAAKGALVDPAAR